MLLAQPALWLWRYLELRHGSHTQEPVTRPDVYRLILVGLLFAGDLAVWHWSIHYTSVANSTLLANFAPIVVAIESWFLFRQRVTRRFVLSMLLAIGGLLLLVRSSAALSVQHLWGDALGLITAGFYGSYILAVSRLRNRFSTATIMMGSGVVSSLGLLVITLVMGEALMPASTQGWWVLIALALVVHVGGQSMIAYALAHLPATFSSLGLLVQPVAAAILAWVILQEAIGPWQALGGVLVLTGIFVARRESKD